MAKEDTSVATEVAPVEPTPSVDSEASTEEIAERPEVKAAFDKAFGSDGATSEGTPTARKEQPPEELAEELEGLDGTSEADDGIEPDGEKTEDAKLPDEVETKPEATPKTAETPDEELSTLNPLLRRAAKRVGWDDEKIDTFYKRDEEGANQTFQQFLSSVNILSARYGALGAPPQQQPQQPPQQATQQPPQQPPQQAAKTVLDDLYGDKLQDYSTRYGQEFMDEVMAPVAKVMGEVQEMRTFFQAQQQELVATEMNTWFGGLGDEFADLYGKGDGMSTEQEGARSQLAMIADRIRGGAAVQNVHMSVSDALEDANLQFASEHLGKLVRQKITKQVKQRNAQITHRPSQRQAPPPPANSDAAALQAYEARAGELGYNVL